MTPSARLRAAQGLLQAFLQGTTPLDVLFRRFARENRYAGAKDRRGIQDTLFAIVRSFEELAWRLKQADAPLTPRGLVIAHLVVSNAFKEDLFEASKYGLSALSGEEKDLVNRLGAITDAPPDHARLNCPEWLYEKFRVRYGQDCAALLEAMNGRAPVTLRVNTLKTTADKLAGEFKEKAVDFEPGRFCPNAVTLPGPVPFHKLPGYHDGWFEAQDEGSQLAGLAVDAKPGMQVADLCAGAGGKALELAAEMANKGQIFAFDIDGRRLEELHRRAQRAGVRNVQAARLPTGKGRAGALIALEGRMDRVAVDAPCSGTGILRRSPELRFRLNREWLAGHVERQKQLLTEAETLAKPGGRMVYVTCSLLPEENERQIEAFLGVHKGWKLLDVKEILGAKGLRQAPETAAEIPETLLLLPHRHGTDGFFVAVLEVPKA